VIRASSRWRAGSSQSNHYYAKNDSIVNEEVQAATLQKSEEKRNYGQSCQPAHHDSEGERRMHLHRDTAVFEHVIEFLKCRACNNRRGQEKGKPGCRDTI
jgi:hypothetical protein